MGRLHTPNNVILFSNAVKHRRQALGSKPPDHCARIMAFTSGKGGVGKTSIVANLGLALRRMGKKVLIMDADLGLGNLDLLLGLVPKYNLSHVIQGMKSVSEIMLEGPESIQVLPAASGIQELAQLTREQRFRIISEIDQVLDTVDILLIDTAAGISSNVTDFNVASQEIFVVVNPEPSSITDAYALMKVLCVKYGEKKFRIIVNNTRSMNEGKEVFRQLQLVVDRFLHIPLEYMGFIIRDDGVVQSSRSRKLLLEVYPDSRASRCVTSLAHKILLSWVDPCPKRTGESLWKHFCTT